MKTAKQFLEENELKLFPPKEYIVSPIKAYNGIYKDEFIKVMEAFHSQFSIGGEAAFERWHESKYNPANPNKRELHDAFMAGTAYSSEGIREGHKIVKGKDLKNN